MNTKSNSLQDILTQDVLRTIAGDRYFERGEDYCRQGCIHDLAMEGNGLSARVSGTEDYEVELWVEDNQLQSACTCPLGVDNIFCKHCVAVGLTWLGNPEGVKTRRGSRSAQKSVTMQEVQRFLEQQDKSTLIQWMLDRIQQDDSWKQQLFLKVASNRPQGVDLTTFRRALRDAIITGDFIEWDETGDYAAGIWDVLGSVADLLEAQPQAVIDLCEYSVSLIETALNSVDDSNGDVGMVLDGFQTLHYKACALAQPNPIALADYLFQAEMESGFGSFSDAVETYAAILGDQGLAHYRELAESMWEEFPPLSHQDAGEWDYKRSKLQRILENLAKASGDVEAVVAIKRKNLSTARTYLDIAQLYLQDGQPDRALEWAESGLKAFDRPDLNLREFVIEEYHRRGRVEDAMALAWQAFTHAFNLYGYQKLKTQANRVNQWDIWRERALTHIRQQLASVPASPTSDQTPQISSRRVTLSGRQATVHQASNPRESMRRDPSLLVEIFLWEGEDELAWQEAKAGGCSQQLWLKLAERRQSTHPADALPIYQQQIEPLIQQTNNTAYANAVSFLQTVRDLMLQLEQQSEFNALVTHLRRTCKAKRNFIALLNQQKW